MKFVPGNTCVKIAGGFLLLTALGNVADAAELKITLPLARTAYQTNESIPIFVQRSDAAALTEGQLVATITAEDNSNARFALPVPAVAAGAGGARRTEILNFSGALLRPGKYTLQIASDGATAQSAFEVHSHVRGTTYKLINWGNPKGDAGQLEQGKLGYNLIYSSPPNAENFIRAGVDVVPINIMGGGHQMDLRMDADWSDPYVLQAGARRAAKFALMYRSWPNVPGLNFYDEPGLTWWKHTETGEFVPHGIPGQVRSYKSATGRDMPAYNKIDPNKPEDVKAWKDFATWKLGLMDAAWKDAAYAVSYVKPTLFSNTQSQYGWTAFTDGYYFNVTRSLPITSGHGGYHDYWLGFFNPSLFLEMARARDISRPNWYLPTWYGNTTNDQMRLENYLSFMTGIQGIMTPPPLEPTNNPIARDAIVETNKVMARVGTIFDTLPPTRTPVTLLYSMSSNLASQVKDRNVNYANAAKHGEALTYAYLAFKLAQQPLQVVVDEDVIDGTLATNHKAIVLAGIDELDPKVVAGLEEFVKNGGLVLKTGDSTVKVTGAIDLGVTGALPDAAIVNKLNDDLKKGVEKDRSKLTPYITEAKYMQGSLPLAKALKAQLDKAGIAPVFVTDVPEVVGARHGAGDIEYIFAVNAAPGAGTNTMRAVSANITLPADGRPVYDAMDGGAAPFTAKGKALTSKFDLGIGAMKVWARTARPIGSVQVTTPIVDKDFTDAATPIEISARALLLDNGGKVLSGAAPMRVQLLDPKGASRYDIMRATKEGVLAIALPLAANDPAGDWTLRVTELLSNKTADSKFAYKTATRNGAAFGATRRAWMLDGETNNLLRFARTHDEVTIVAGTGDYAGAIQRLQKVLEPWGVKSRVMDVAEAAKARSVSMDEAPTWIGLSHTPKDSIKAGEGNNPMQVGFAVSGPVILLGTAEDNALIKFVQDNKYLPITPKKDEVPGAGRGLVAWQLGAIRSGQESVTLIAHDAAGMDEAIGTFYEAVAALEPLTKWTLPAESSIGGQ